MLSAYGITLSVFFALCATSLGNVIRQEDEIGPLDVAADEGAHRAKRSERPGYYLPSEDSLMKRPQRFSFGLGKRILDEYTEDELNAFVQEAVAEKLFSQPKDMEKREPYAFGLGKRDPYQFGLGKRDPYQFGLGKREPYAFGLGKRAQPAQYYGFGLGKREPYAFGLGK